MLFLSMRDFIFVVIFPLMIVKEVDDIVKRSTQLKKRTN